MSTVLSKIICQDWLKVGRKSIKLKIISQFPMTVIGNSFFKKKTKNKKRRRKTQDKTAHFWCWQLKDSISSTKIKTERRLFNNWHALKWIGDFKPYWQCLLRSRTQNWHMGDCPLVWFTSLCMLLSHPAWNTLYQI